MAHSTHDQ